MPEGASSEDGLPPGVKLEDLTRLSQALVKALMSVYSKGLQEGPQDVRDDAQGSEGLHTPDAAVGPPGAR